MNECRMPVLALLLGTLFVCSSQAALTENAADFHAETDTEFVLGSAASHPYELALGFYSVHTSPASLQAGERRLAEIKVRLQKEGRL
jgi:hypothetical protein